MFWNMIKYHNKLPNKCPACDSPLTITEIKCIECDTSINNSFDLPSLMTLDEKEQEFILNFVKSSGSLKEMAKQMNLSYPTVRKYLNNIIDKLK